MELERLEGGDSVFEYARVATTENGQIYGSDDNINVYRAEQALGENVDSVYSPQKRGSASALSARPGQIDEVNAELEGQKVTSNGTVVEAASSLENAPSPEDPSFGSKGVDKIV